MLLIPENSLLDEMYQYFLDMGIDALQKEVIRGMFKFDSLQILHQDMMKKDESRDLFPFSYNGKNFSCIFVTDITPIRLYLTTLGNAPITFELEINKDYCTSPYLDDYKLLVAYLDIKYDPNYKFKPVDFFEALNRKIPRVFMNAPSYKEVIQVASLKRNLEEADKIYFCGWRSNPLGSSVREKNLEKTRSAFGDQIADMCKQKNISSRWTDIDSEEDLARLNEIYML